MNVIAMAAHLNAERVKNLSFEVMDNHLHFVMCGRKPDIDEMFSYMFNRTRRSIPLTGGLSVSYKPIEDLSSARNHIVYTHRNGYVANHNHTPFSYPWGTNAYYFMPKRNGIPFSQIKSIENRRMFRGRDVKLPPDWQVLDGYVDPSSYCDIETGMALFRDANHYFSLVSKNVEAYSGVAVELDDGEFLTDQELFSKILSKVRDQYHLTSLRELTTPQRYDLAKALHYEYRSSNGQIRRVLGISEFEVNTLFPLGK